MSAHRSNFRAVCKELHYAAWMLCGDPMFAGLRYEGVRPFNPIYSGAREIAVYIGECWEPYLTCRWCNRKGGCDCNGPYDNELWSETDSMHSSSSDDEEHGEGGDSDE